jgi:hypothetical protein
VTASPGIDDGVRVSAGPGDVQNETLAGPRLGARLSWC